MKPLKKVLVQIIAALCLLCFALACNTVKGAGRDIQRGGEAVEDAAETAQR